MSTPVTLGLTSFVIAILSVGSKTVSVRIRMKKLGRSHQAFFRICAVDRHAPRDGRVLEELGTYDPRVPETDARAIFNAERVDYWLSVGAQPSDNVAVLIKKYGTNGTHAAAQKAALEKLAQPKTVPDPGARSVCPSRRRRRKRQRQPRVRLRLRSQGWRRLRPKPRRQRPRERKLYVAEFSRIQFPIPELLRVQLRCAFDVLTLFPEIFSGYLGQSVLKRAIDAGIVSVQLHNIRDWAQGKHRQVDDRPFGGGPGMVLRPEPVVESVEAVRSQGDEPGHLILLTPQGRRFDQRIAAELSEYKRLVLICGRYEGVDQRAIDLLQPDEISVGDYILGGGEVAAMVVIDAVARLVPGVLGDEESNKQDSFSGDRPLLEFPQYTRPREYRGLKVPEVLMTGNHPDIARWREQQQLDRTRDRRADLLGEDAAERRSDV